MKFLLKSKKFWIIFGIIIVIGIGVLIKAKSGTKAPEYVTAEVKRGDLIQTVSATGKVESASETNLNFRQSGTLAKILVKPGATVKTGQLLAQLQSAGSQSSVNQARAGLEQAQADLLSVQSGSSMEAIDVSRARVTQAEADFASAQATLSQTKQENNQNLISLKEQAINKASESSFLTKSSIEDVNSLINESDYEDTLNIYAFSNGKALQKYEAAAIKKDELARAYPNYKLTSSNEELIALMDLTDIALKAADEMLDSAYDLISLVTTNNSISQASIDAFKSAFSTDQSAVAAKISAVQTAKSNLQTKGIEYNNNVSDAENSVAKYQAALDVAKAELILKAAGPRDFEKKLAQAKVAQAQAALNKALADLSDYNINAPVDGIISKINYEVGELVSSVNPVISLISESNFQIKVDVPESDIAKVMVGDLTAITLDAFGSDKNFEGHVTFVDPAETIINDVVYYKVTVTLDHQETDVKSGMTANLIITTSSRQGVLNIPQRAVYEQGNKRFVKVLANNQPQETEITTGLRADEGLIEVLNGLNEGQIVITFTKEAK